MRWHRKSNARRQSESSPSPLLGLLFAVTTALGLSACGTGRRTGDMTTADAGNGDKAAMAVSFIDVGKGDCILVENDGHVMLIDTGYEETTDSVVAYLEEQDVDALDVLVLTHYDKDHVGGTEGILESVEVGRIILPAYEGKGTQYERATEVVTGSHTRVDKVSADMSLSLGDATIGVIPSSVPYDSDGNGGEGNDNDMSLVVTLSHGDDSYLFAGDIEKDGISSYLSSERGRYDVIKMPHHGKQSGKLKALIEATSPKIAVITDSTDEPADDKVLELLEKRNINAYRTSTDGTIVIRGDGTGSYEVTGNRSE